MVCGAASTVPAQFERCVCMATVMSATCCGLTPARTLWILTTAAWGRPFRICGCCCRERAEMTRQLADLLAGYEDFYDFDPRELHLIEALRTLRLIHYAAWIARRWDDPAFPVAFPWFNTQRYWQDRILELREQIALMDEPPLWIT